MTAQEAAAKILNEKGMPLTSDEIARTALERDMVNSRAKDPVRSIASTIEKNIRDGTYNDPPLEFIESNRGRLVGLPGMNGVNPEHKAQPRDARGRLEVIVPQRLLEKLHLASQAGIAEDFEGTVSLILEKGLTALRGQVKAGLLRKIEEI